MRHSSRLTDFCGADNQMSSDLPAASGLYDPRFEHDACGVSFVANIKGVCSRDIVSLGIGALCNMEHRGATGAEEIGRASCRERV